MRSNPGFFVPPVPRPNKKSKTLAELERFRKALTPSEVTKQAYMCKFTVPLPDIDENGEECIRHINVPWIVIKQIMAAILEQAAQV